MNDDERKAGKTGGCSSRVEEVEEWRARAQRLEELNRELARANAHAAELMAELELKEESIRRLNATLARANAHAAELVVELEERKKELERANRELAQANEEKSKLLGVAAHDLRGGIGGIQGLAAVLAETFADSKAEAGEYVRLIHDESARLLELLESLLDVSRVEQGRIDLRPEYVELQGIVRQSIRFYKTFAEAKDQTLTLNGLQDPVEVLADQRRIRQVIDNLVSNAIKYSRPNEEIVVRVWKTEKEGGVSVLDRGPGISAEDQKKLFKAFQLLSAKPTGGEERHGLGLAIAQKVVELHGGRIYARNREDGPGAEFAFAIPLAGVAPIPGNILVVDDAATSQKLLSALLTRQGHSVEIAGSGKEALKILEQKTFDLVFMDAEMPEMDGRAAIRAIREREEKERRHTPIIAMTGHTDDEYLAEIREAGADDAVSKPVNARMLALLVNRWLKASTSRKAASNGI